MECVRRAFKEHGSINRAGRQRLQSSGFAQSGPSDYVLICFMPGRHDTLWHSGKLHPGVADMVTFEPFQRQCYGRPGTNAHSAAVSLVGSGL